jgi:hypothetical protein
MNLFDKQKMEDANKKLFQNENNLTIKNLIFIYTPIKVGSTTLVTSIRISTISKFAVLHIHDEECLEVLTGIKNIKIKDIIIYNSMLGKNVYVIDVYRSPIERKISTFFELIEMHFNNNVDEIMTYSLNRITKRFNNIFLHIANDDYFMEKFEIPLPESFDFEKKYLLIKENNIQYIKLRLCDSKDWGEILSTILNNEIFIINDYETSNKKINLLYENFKNNYKIPSNLLEELKKDSFLNYYFSLEEKEKYLNNWSSKQIEEEVKVYNEEEYKLYFSITLENRIRYNIQLNHYLDLGCKCNICNNKRRILIEKAKKGEIIKERVCHNELVKENLLKIKKNINKKQMDLKGKREGIIKMRIK